jgi:hypothetical protein
VSGDFIGTERFEIHRRIGAGGMGVVYQAYDRKRHAMVALKTLRNRDAAALFRLKQEFRGLADISHHNLATLHELVSSDDQWFFTMELVEGEDFLGFVRGDEPSSSPVADTLSIGPEDEGPTAIGGAAPGPRGLAPDRVERLRSALRQLADGVHALHAAGKLHRDIKPSNVLVTPTGRVVLLDFGLVTELASAGDHTSTRSLVGTASYMSPEQGASRPLTPASDWYSVGIMVYEALTGCVPFEGPPLLVLMAKQEREPLPPRELVPEVPDDLDALCQALLRRDPRDRPAGAEILRRLGQPVPRPAGRERPAGPGGRPFLGRQVALRALDDALTASRLGRSVITLVHGHSGMGKSALLARFAGDVAAAGTLVLAGRCYERESVPYKGLDSLIDALSSHLGGLADAELQALLPPDFAAVARLFPVLLRLRAAGDQVHQIAALDPVELRRRAVGALRRLLEQLALRRPLLLCIDDLQWGDLDSSSLLLDLLRPPDPPPFLLLLCYRSDAADQSEPLRRLLTGLAQPGAVQELRELSVQALAPDEARTLARSGLGETAEERLVDAIARESGGSPFFVDALVRHVSSQAFRPASDRQEPGTPPAEVLARGLAVNLEDAIAARIIALPPPARALLQLVATAAGPVEPLVVLRAAALSGDQESTLQHLRAQCLVQATGAAAGDRIEIYHDRIREVTLATMDAEQRRDCHLRLACALEASGTSDPEALFLHYSRAERRDRAGNYAVRAAENAARALAFDRAASLFRSALDCLPADATPALRLPLQLSLGDALANAGRGAEAAAEYLAGCPLADTGPAIELRRRAAEQLLRTGHLDEGLAELRTVLAVVDLDLAATPRRALMSLLGRRVQARLRGLRFRQRAASQVPPAVLAQIDVCWSAALGLGLTDNIRGADFQTRNLLLSLRAGEPYRIARALAMEAAFAATGGAATAARSRQLASQARALAETVDSPHALALALFAEAMTAYQLGNWRDSFAGFERCAHLYQERCTGVAFELAAVQRFAVDALFNLGELAELQRRVPGHLHAAERRGDRYGAAEMRTGLPGAAWLVVDRADEARAQVEEAMRGWSQHSFHLQHYYDALARAHIDLYSGAAAAAHQRFTALWPHLRRHMLLRIQAVRIEATYTRGKVALAAAAASTAAAEPLLREAERAAARLDRESSPARQPLADALRAGIARQRGQEAQALSRLAAASAGFARAGMKAHAAATRWQHGALLGGADGAVQVADALRFFRDQVVVRPEAFAAILIAGPTS